MSSELHIRINPAAEDPTSIADDFPYEPGQTLVLQSMELAIIDLGEVTDTTYVQEWYLNGHDAVASFFIVSDDEPQ